MKIYTSLLLTFVSLGALAQKKMVWPDKKTAAIVLTYDDALPSQLDVAIPQLDAANLKGTFFLYSRFTAPELVRWKTNGKHGHELANHSLFHPCPAAAYPTDPRYTAENYTINNMLREISVMNTILSSLDSLSSHTFAFPCSQAATGNGSYLDSLRLSHLVEFARGGGGEHAVVVDFQNLDLFNVPAYGPLDRPSGTRLVDFVKRTQQSGGLGVLMFHGVGGDYLDVSAEAHQELINYLKAHEKEIWVGTFKDVLRYVAEKRK